MIFLIFQSGIVQYTKGEEFGGLLIVSSHRVYIMKITNTEG